jgi:hypothetical protein
MTGGREDGRKRAGRGQLAAGREHQITANL